MSKSVLLTFFQLVLIQINAASQADARFAPFQGTVYDIPEDYLSSGYGVWVPHLDVLGHITLDSLAIPRTDVYVKKFPGVYYRTHFGIVFLSSLEISRKGCYEFYLESDDGSILWIEDSLIIDNDKPHQMTMKRDTLMMDTGRYAVKVWYYNAYAAQYGLIFKCWPLPDSVKCEYENVSGGKRKLTIDLDNVLFDFNSYVITPAGMKELDKLRAELNQSEFRKIHIIGYTDNVGTAEYNNALSLKRAQSIMAYLKTKLHKRGIVFEAEGRGSSNPLTSDTNPEHQHLNRRVEIYID